MRVEGRSRGRGPVPLPCFAGREGEKGLLFKNRCCRAGPASDAGVDGAAWEVVRGWLAGATQGQERLGPCAFRGC